MYKVSTSLLACGLRVVVVAVAAVYRKSVFICLFVLLSWSDGCF